MASVHAIAAVVTDAAITSAEHELISRKALSHAWHNDVAVAALRPWDMDAAEAFGTTGDINVLFSEEFSTAAAAIYPTFQEGCGIPVVEALLTDYAFGGIPATLTSGPTAFVVDNNGAAGEAHEMLLIRVNDDVDLTAEELLALPDEELAQNATLVNAAITPATGTTAGVVVNLTPGRYVYACFVAEGSVDGAEGSGPPHFTMGMFGEFTVD